MFQFVETESPGAIIRVLGVGGGGGNAVNHMLDADIDGVEFVCANTDSQALKSCRTQATLQLGAHVTKGLGAGANPEIGRQSALEDRERIIEVLQGADMVFITAGMGGGTGTGAAPVVAQIAKEMGILTVAVVTKPFPFEGRRRMQVAVQGIEELAAHVDSLITIPNEKLSLVLGGEISLINAFNAANDVLRGAVQGIAELITRPGLINVDFADVRTVMAEMGMAMMGSGSAKGEDRAIEAAESAIGSPLLEDIDLTGACGILVNVTAGLNLTMREFEEVGGIIGEFASDDATVVVGTSIDPDLQDELRVTVVATGLVTGREKSQNSVRLVKEVASGEVDYSTLASQPAVQRAHVRTGIDQARTGTDQMRAGADQGRTGTNQVRTGTEVAPELAAQPEVAGRREYLDIPAFLRQQAD